MAKGRQAAEDGLASAALQVRRHPLRIVAGVTAAAAVLDASWASHSDAALDAKRRDYFRNVSTGQVAPRTTCCAVDP